MKETNFYTKYWIGDMVIPLKLLNLQLDFYLQDHGSYKIKKERPSKQGQGSQ